MEPFEQNLARLSGEEADYLIAQLPMHLVQAESWDRLDSILTEFGFVKAKSSRAGIYRLISDYIVALQRYPDGRAQRKEIQAIARMLKRQAPTLLAHPDLLFQQFYNEAVIPNSLTADFLSRLEAARARQSQPWLHTRPCFPFATEPLRLLEAAGQKLEAIAASRDDRWIAATSRNGVTVWRVDSGERQWVRDDLIEKPWLMGFADEDVLLGVGDTLFTLQAETGHLIHSIRLDQRIALASPLEDGKFAVLEQDGQLTLRSGRAGNVRTDLGKLPGFTGCLAITPDASLVATGREQGRVLVWSAKSGAIVADLGGHGMLTEIPAGLPDDPYWSDPLTEIVGFIGSGKGAVRFIAFSPDGQTLAVGCDSAIKNRSLAEVRLWDTASWQIKNSVTALGSIRQLAWGPNHETIVALDDDIRIWSTRGDPPRMLAGRRGQPVGFAFLRREEMLAIGRPDAIELWEMESAGTTTARNGHRASVRTVALSADASLAASGSHSSEVLVWEVSTGQRKMRLSGHREAVYQVRFSPSGKLLASGSEDGTGILWDLQRGCNLLQVEAASGSVGSCVFSPDEQWLSAVGSREHLLIHVPDGTVRSHFRASKFYGISQAFSPSSQQFVIASASELTLWELNPANSDPLHKTKDLGRPTSFWGAVAFSQSGNTIAYADTKQVWLLNLVTEQPRLLGEHDGEVLALAFSADGAFLASGGQGAEDGSSAGDIRIWRIPSGDEFAFLPCADRVMAILFVGPMSFCFADAGGAANAPRVSRVEIVQPCHGSV
jgi:WD40 repeat protein